MIGFALMSCMLMSTVNAESNDTSVKTIAVNDVGTLRVGGELPSFNGLSSVGERVSSRTLIGNGQVLIVSYAATWCQPCRQGIPIIERLVHKDNAVQAVYITLDKESFKVQRWASELGIQNPVIVDKFNAIAKRHGVVTDGSEKSTEIPLTIVVDARGVVTQILTTEGIDFEDTLLQAIESAKQLEVSTETKEQMEGVNESKMYRR